MKLQRQTLILLLAAGMASCSTNDNEDGTATLAAPGATTTTTAASSTDATNLDIALYTEAITEDETIPSDASTEEYNDYIENDDDYEAGWANTFTLTYSDSGVEISGWDASDTDFEIVTEGAHVTVTAQKKAHYILEGAATNGSFTIEGAEKKAWVSLGGLELSSAEGSVISKNTDKRLYLEVKDGTVNTLSDGTQVDHKATVYSAGKLAISGGGSLSVTGNYKNCIHSSDYIRLRKNTNCTLAVAANNAMKASDSIVVEGGTLNVTVASDANNGLSADALIRIKGGVQNVSVASTAGKGVSSDGNVEIDGGRLTVITTGGGTWDSSDGSTSACAGIKADADFVISGGAVYLKSTGAGGKGISADGAVIVSDGIIRIVTTGSRYKYGSGNSSAYRSSPKGIKADGEIKIAGGDIVARCTGGEGSECVESKSTLTIAGGDINLYGYDDCINSSGHMYIQGGTITVKATNNDGLDANGNLYIQGGTTMAFGASAPECGIDANEESNYTVYFTGGNLLAVGGGNSTPSNSTSTQPYVTASGSLSAGSAAGISDYVSFTPPYSASGSILITCPGLSSGNTYTLFSGSSTASVTAQQYGSGSMGGGGGNAPGGGGPGRRL